MNNFLTIQPQTECKDLGSFFTQEICLPTVEICDETPTDNILTHCGSQWNCNLCPQDKEYFIPYVSGDKIQIQTMFLDFYNSNKESPVTGWGATPANGFMAAVLYDNVGNSISITLSDFASRSMVGWNGTNSYQIIEIDTGLSIFDTNKCWQLEIRAYDTDNFITQTLCSQMFAERPCERLVKLKGTFDTFDCDKHFYGSPVAYVGDNFRYDNTLRYYGQLVDTGVRVNKTVVGIKRTVIVSSMVKTLALHGLHPPFIKNILFNQHIGAQQFYINDVEHEQDQISFDNLISRGNMWQIEQDVEKVCELYTVC